MIQEKNYKTILVEKSEIIKMFGLDDVENSINLNFNIANQVLEINITSKTLKELTVSKSSLSVN